MLPESPALPNVIFTVDEALDALESVIHATPTVAITGTLTDLRHGQRWANGEIAAHAGDGAVAARLRLSFPPGSVPSAKRVEVGNHVRVAGRFVVDRRFGPLQFRVDSATVLAQQSPAAADTAELIKAIQAEDLHTLQKRFHLASDTSRLAVVCPQGRGAGGTDFIQILENSAHDWTLRIREVAMGGVDAAPKLAAAVRTLHHSTDIEAIVICRGGGAASDLAPFDSPDLARAIVEAELPVVIAVGHAHNTTVADLVAHATHPTPSAAAEWFIEQRHSEIREAQRRATRIREAQAVSSQARSEAATQRAERSQQLAVLVIAAAFILICVAIVVVVL